MSKTRYYNQSIKYTKNNQSVWIQTLIISVTGSNAKQIEKYLKENKNQQDYTLVFKDSYVLEHVKATEIDEETYNKLFKLYQ